MHLIGLLAAAILAVFFGLHLLTAGITAWRVTRPAAGGAPKPLPEPIGVIVPVAGLNAEEQIVAMSALKLAGPGVELIYCAFDASDPAAMRISTALAVHPDIPARLMVGRTQATRNPKLDNTEKALAVLMADLVVMIDGNVEVPADLIERLWAVWDPQAGMASSPPLGVRPVGFWAEVECAFLNTLFVRWQLAADQLFGGVAHGKVFMLRRSLIAARGGIEALRRNAAEDASAAKLVAGAGLKLRLTRRPFEQPIGRRRFTGVWSRNRRWTLARRQAYPLLYACEWLLTVAAPLAAGLAMAAAFGWSLPLIALLILAAWYGVEAALAILAGWPCGPWFIPACLTRDVLALVLWSAGWFGSRYAWRGQTVDIAAPDPAAAAAQSIVPR